MKLVEQERAEGNAPTGIIAKGVFDSDHKIGFDIIDLATDNIIPLARIDWQIPDGFQAGKYIFSRDTFDSACRALLNYHQGGVVFLDEVGPLELSGGGYADCLRRLLDSDINKLYVIVRESCVSELIEKFLLNHDYEIKLLNELT